LAAAGRNGDVPTVFNTLPLTCAICFGPYSPSEMRSAGCSHYYCHECWRNFIRAVVGDGLRCLLMRCPDPGCSVPVVRELVDAAAAGEVRARYNMFVVCRSWRRARASTSGGAPAPGARSEPGYRVYEVECECKHFFCFRRVGGQVQVRW
jgi:ariadne-1